MGFPSEIADFWSWVGKKSEIQRSIRELKTSKNDEKLTHNRRSQPNEPLVDKIDKVDEVYKVDEVDKVDKVDKVDEVDKVEEVDKVDEIEKVDKTD